MNNSIFRIALFLVVAVFVACGGDKAVRDSARDSINGNTEGVTDPTTAPGTMTASAPGGVMHYTCPKNCPGSGGSAAGSCPVCGTAYVHNQAFHDQTQTQTPPTGEQTIEKMTFPGTTTTTPVTPGTTATAPPEPAQNAAGVWHYTCPKGCAGGGGAQGACGTCGGPLAHNTAYHQ